MDTRELEKELLAGLEGVTPEPRTLATVALGSNMKDAEFFRLCSPENIRALLDTIAELRATVVEGRARIADLDYDAAGQPVKWKDIRWAFLNVFDGKVQNEHGQWVLPATAKHGGSNAE